MNRISYDRIIPLLVGQQSTSGITGLIRDIIILQSRLENPDSQSFYFQKGMKSHQAKFNEMKVRYNDIAKIINHNDMDYFKAKIHEHEVQIQKIKSDGYIGFMKRFAYQCIQSNIDYNNDLIQIKNQFGKLKNLNELLEDEESMMKIFSY